MNEFDLVLIAFALDSLAILVLVLWSASLSRRVRNLREDANAASIIISKANFR